MLNRWTQPCTHFNIWPHEPLQLTEVKRRLKWGGRGRWHYTYSSPPLRGSRSRHKYLKAGWLLRRRTVAHTADQRASTHVGISPLSWFTNHLSDKFQLSVSFWGDAQGCFRGVISRELFGGHHLHDWLCFHHGRNDVGSLTAVADETF